jgi:hypothetical protein
MVQARGKVLLLVSGILLILLGGIIIFGNLLNASKYLSNIPVFTIELLLGVFGIFVGGFGIKNSSAPEKAQQCIIVDIILMGVLVAGVISDLILDTDTDINIGSLATTSGAEMAFTIAFLIVCLSIVYLGAPLLYLIGAIMNKQNPKNRIHP